MRSFIVAILVLITLLPTFAVAQTITVQSEFLQIREVLNEEGERIDLIERDLGREIARLRSCLSGLRSDQRAHRADLEARMAELEEQVAAIPRLRQGLADLRASIERGNLRLDQIQGLVDRFGERLDALEGRVADLELRVDDLVGRMERVERDVRVLRHNALRFGVGTELGFNSDIETGLTTGFALGLRYGAGENSFGVAHARLGTSNDGWDFVPSVRLTWLRSLTDVWSVGGGVGCWLDTGARNISGFEATGFPGLIEVRALVANNLEFHMNAGPALVTARGGATGRGEANIGLTWWFGQ